MVCTATDRQASVVSNVIQILALRVVAPTVWWEYGSHRWRREWDLTEKSVQIFLYFILLLKANSNANENNVIFNYSKCTSTADRMFW